MTTPKYRPRPAVPLPPPRQWMTAIQVAQHLGCSKMTVYRLIERGDLRAYRVGRSIKVDVADINSYLAGAELGWKLTAAAEQ